MQPPEHHDHNELGSLVTWAILVVASILGASFSVIRKKCAMKVAAYHIMLASFCGPLFASLYFGLVANPSIYLGAVICGLTGLMIFGIATNFEKTDKRIENVDTLSMLPKTGTITPEEAPRLEKKVDHDH